MDPNFILGLTALVFVGIFALRNPDIAAGIVQKGLQARSKTKQAENTTGAGVMIAFVVLFLGVLVFALVMNRRATSRQDDDDSA